MKAALKSITIILAFFLVAGTVKADPQLVVTPVTYTFNNTYTGQTTSAMFLFANTGDQPVVVSDITFTDPAFSIQYTSFTIGPGESGELPVNFSPTAAGFYDGLMQIFSNDPVNNPYEIQLYGTASVELIDGWEWIQTPYDYIYTDMIFPEGQNQIGYCVGQANTYNGEGIVVKTTDGGDTWTQMTPAGTLWLTAISFLDVNTGFVAGWGGDLLKTVDGGQTWTNVTVNPSIYKITDVEFRDQNHGVVSTIGDGIFVTNNGGQTWTQATGVTIEPMMMTYASDTVIFGVGSQDVILRSTDGGYSWTQLYTTGSSDNILLGVYFLNDQYGMAAGDYGHVYKTVDGGDTWTMTIPNGDDILHVPYIWDEDTAWVAGTPELVYKTTNGGSSWNIAYNGNYQRAFYRITFTDNYTGFICGSHGVVLRKAGFDGPVLKIEPNPVVFDDTYTGETATAMVTFANTGNDTLHITGITFSDPSFSIDYASFTINPGESGELPVYFTPSAAGLIEGTMQIFSDNVMGDLYEVQMSGNGMIFYNEGWEMLQVPFNYIFTDMEFPGGQNQVGYVVGQANTYNGEGIVIKTTDGGDSWQQVTPSGTPWLNGMSFIDENTGFVCGWGGDLMKTTDGGVTWESITVQNDIFKILDVEFRDINKGVVSTLDNGVFVTSDGGQTWTQATGIDVAPKKITFAAGNILFGVGIEDRIFKSVNGGYDWTLQYTSGTVGNVLLGVHFLNSQYGMAAGDYGHVYKTTDGGDTWTLSIPAGDDLLHTPFIWDTDTAWIAGTPELVYKSTDGGNSWNNAYNGNNDKAFYKVLFTTNYTGFICGSQGTILRKQGLPEVPAINVNPVALDFGQVNVGETYTMPVTISNTGYAVLLVTNIITTNSAFSIDTTLFSVDPGASYTVNVTFNPSMEGPFFGQLQITSNDPENNVMHVNLTGVGVVPAIELDQTSIAFDTTLINETSTEILTIENTGQGTLHVSGITLSNPAFSVNMTNFYVMPGGNQQVEVTFAPTQQMLYEGILLLASNDPASPALELPLSGYGDINTGSFDKPFESNISFFPNPAINTLFVKNAQDWNLEIYDLLGNRHLSVRITSGYKEISVAALKQGLYIVKIESKNGTLTKKLKITR